MDLGKRTHENAAKIIYLCKHYPKKKNIKEIGELWQGSLIDFNAGAWLAQDLGYMDLEKNTKIKLNKKKLPNFRDNSFGEEVTHLIDTLPYVFKRLAEKEGDLEEGFLVDKWCPTYTVHDLIVAINFLIERKVLASYEISTESKDEKGKKFSDTYTFYTLLENLEHRWGRKQFPDKTRIKE